MPSVPVFCEPRDITMQYIYTYINYCFLRVNVLGSYPESAMHSRLRPSASTVYSLVPKMTCVDSLNNQSLTYTLTPAVVAAAKSNILSLSSIFGQMAVTAGH